MKWYNKYDKKSGIGSLNCPTCNHRFDQRIIYIIEPNSCPGCAREIGFIDMISYHPITYTIDLGSCPELIKVAFHYLATKNPKEGHEQLKELVLMITSTKDDQSS